MSTTFGIYTNYGLPAIILAADTQATQHDADDKPDIKEHFSKLRLGKNHALLFSGNWDSKLEAFFSYLSGKRDYENFVRHIAGRSARKDFPELGTLLHYIATTPDHARARMADVLAGRAENMSAIEKAVLDERTKGNGRPETWTDATVIDFMQMLSENHAPVEKAISLGYLEPFNTFNRFMKKKDPEYEAPDLIIAANSPELRLVRVDDYGTLHEPEDTGEFEYICKGSGSELVEQYIQGRHFEKDLIFPTGMQSDKITIPVAIRMAIKCLKIAAKDIYTNTPFELVVIDERGITNHSEEMKRIMDDAEKDSYRTVEEHYLDRPEPQQPRYRTGSGRKKPHPAQMSLIKP